MFKELAGKSIALLLLLAVGVCGRQSVLGQETLRWKFQPGQQFDVQFVQNMDVKTTRADQTLKVAVEMLMVMHWQVESVGEDGAARLAQSFSRVRLKMTTPTVGAIEYDSAAKKKPIGEAGKIAADVKPLLEAKFHVTMSSRGKIEKVELDPTTAAAFDQQAKKQGRPNSLFAKEKVEEILRQPALLLPEKPLAEGDDWMETRQVQSPLGKLVQQSTYTLATQEERGDRKLAKIAVQTSIKLDRPANAEGPKVEIKEQQQTGTLYFDNAAGRLVESELKQQLTTETRYREFLFRASAYTTSRTTIGETKVVP